MKRSLKVDLHRTQFTVCTRRENGRTYLRQWPMPAYRASNQHERPTRGAQRLAGGKRASVRAASRHKQSGGSHGSRKFESYAIEQT